MDDRFRFWFIDENSQQWEDLHKHTYRPLLFTASNVPSILGMGYDSPATMYELYKGEKEKRIDMFLKRILDYGKTMEPIALEDFYDNYCGEWTLGAKPGPLIHKDIPWLLASVDQILYNPSTRELALLEIKCPWTSCTPEYVEEVSSTYLIQVQIQMLVTGVEKTFLYIYGRVARALFEIPYDPDLCHIILYQLEQFKNRIDNCNKPPRRKGNSELETVIQEFLPKCKKCVHVSSE